MSVAASIGYVAFLAGPPLIGFAGNHTGVLHALTITAGVLGLALLVSGAIAPLQPDETADEADAVTRADVEPAAPNAASRPMRTEPRSSVGAGGDSPAESTSILFCREFVVPTVFGVAPEASWADRSRQRKSVVRTADPACRARTCVTGSALGSASGRRRATNSSYRDSCTCPGRMYRQNKHILRF